MLDCKRFSFLVGQFFCGPGGVEFLGKEKNQFLLDGGLAFIPEMVVLPKKKRRRSSDAVPNRSHQESLGRGAFSCQ